MDYSMHLGNFASMTIFALFISIVVAAVGEGNIAARLRHAASSFALLMLISIGVAWLLFPLSR